MLLASAEQAAALAPQIRELMGVIAELNGLTTAHDSMISGYFKMASGFQRDIRALTDVETAVIANAMIQVFQTRLDALNAQLGALQ